NLSKEYPFFILSPESDTIPLNIPLQQHDALNATHNTIATASYSRSSLRLNHRLPAESRKNPRNNYRQRRPYLAKPPIESKEPQWKDHETGGGTRPHLHFC